MFRLKPFKKMVSMMFGGLMPYSLWITVVPVLWPGVAKFYFFCLLSFFTNRSSLSLVYYRKDAGVSLNMGTKVTADASTITVSSGSSPKTIGSPGSEGVRDREDRAWKAYLSSADSAITSSLLVNGEDLSMATNLGFLYDYYEVTEEASQAPSSPPNSR